MINVLAIPQGIVLTEKTANIVFRNQNNETKIQVQAVLPKGTVALDTIDNFLSLESMREFLSTAPWEGEHRKDTKELKDEYEKVREKLAIPSMTLSFYTSLLYYKRIPTFYEFRANYIDNQPQYFTTLDDEYIKVLYKNQNKKVRIFPLDTRLWIAYGGLVRDVVGFYLLAESGVCEYIKLSTKNDFENKVDIIAKLKGSDKEVIIDFKNTRSKDAQKKIKVKDGVLLIDMGIDPSLGDRVGEYDIFNEKIIEILKLRG